MRNNKLDQLCAKRLKSEDFAEPQFKYQPLLTRNETIAFAVLFLIAITILSYLTATTYFRG